jgi:hypothetical protein
VEKIGFEAHLFYESMGFNGDSKKATFFPDYASISKTDKLI